MRAFRRITTLVTVGAMVVGLSSVSPVRAVAAPPDPGVARLAKFLTDPTGSLQAWSQGLGGLGKLAESLPALPTSPGAALGFSDLLGAAFDAGTKKLSQAVQDADLNIDEPISIAGGRSGTLKTSLSNAGGDKRLSVELTIARDLLDQPLTVNVPIGTGSNAPQSAFSSTGGVKLRVAADLRFDVVWDSASDTVYLRVDQGAGTPRLGVKAHAEFSDKTAVRAAIGILGVELVNDNSSSLTLDANFTGTVSDPNNDGRLAFENADHTPGELAQGGSLAGLVHFGFASPAGSLHGDLHLKVGASGTSIPLPAVDARISVDWPDISTGTPEVTSSGLPSVGKFLNMTPRDLAVGIAQLVTSLTSIQSAKSKTDPSFGNLDLPFLKGTLADAIQLNEQLKKFLAEWTYPAEGDPKFDPATDDPAKAGEPKFVSLQQFLDLLNGVLVGSGGGVSNVGYDDSTSKLKFTLTLKHDAPAAPVELNANAAASSGPATAPGKAAATSYGSMSLQDNNQAWTPGAFAGLRVVAGNSGATIESNTATKLVLKAPGWSPAVPEPNAPYSISGMQSDVGTVTLGNGLQTPDPDPSKPGHGIGAANAVNATAKVTPSYRATLTLVLDLQPPVVHDPPIEQKNPDGSTVLVSSTPTGADRVLLRTSNSNLLTADFPIEAGIDIFATAGFLQARLKGKLEVCHSGAPADCTGSAPNGQHMLEIALKDKGDITFGQLVRMLLDDPKQLLDVDVNVRAAGSVTASIPGAENFFPGGDPQVGFHWNDLTVLSPADADGPHIDFAKLSRLAKVDFDPSNPRALFSIILKTLQTLSAALGKDSPTDSVTQKIFTTPIPVLGRSLGQLLQSDESGVGPQVSYGTNTLTDASRSDKNGQPSPSAFPSTLVGRSIVVGGQVGIVAAVSNDTLTMASNWQTKPADGTAYTARSELDDAISILENSPSDNMQALVALLNARLGHNTPITFGYADDAKVGNVPSLVIKLNWKRSFHTSAPVQFDFSLPIGDQRLAGVQGDGSISIGAGGEITLGLVVPLAPGDGPADSGALKILDDSKIDLKVDAAVDNGSLTTTIGPLSLSLGDPKGPEKAVARASYSLGLGKSGASGAAASFSQFLADVAPSVNASSAAADCGLTGGTVPLSLCARLPLFVSSDGGATYSRLIATGGDANAFTLRLPKQPQNGQGVLDVIDPAGGTIDGHKRVETPDAAELGTAIKSHLIDLTRIDGIGSFLNLLQQALQTASFGGKLPLVGKDLQQGADFVGKLKTTIDAALGDLAGVADIPALRAWVNDKLAAGLEAAGLNPDLVRVDTQCTVQLSPAEAPKVELSAAGDAGTTTYQYAVVAYVKNSSDSKFDANPGSLGKIETGPAAKADGVSPAKALKLTWAAVEGAAGYKVYRLDGGTLRFLADTGTALAFTDDGSKTPGAAPTNPSGANPFRTDCDYADFDSVLIRLDVSNGNFAGETLACAGLADPHKCLTRTVPLDIGIPGLSLKAATPGDGPAVELGWRLHLAFGISRADGFFVDTKDSDPQPEFAVGLNFTLPDKVKAQLAFINVEASNCVKSDTVNCDSSAPASPNPLFSGTFKIDITSPHANGRLTLADLGSGDLSSYFKVKLKANVDIDLLLKATAFDDAGAGFPGIQAELQLKWSFADTDPNKTDGTGLSIAFKKVQIDAGEVFGQILGPIIRQIKKVTGPLDPIIKTLYAPIPVLSDLSHLVGGDDVTLVSIAKAYTTMADGPDLTLVERLLALVQVINAMPDGEHVLIPIGSFQLSGSKAISTTATPDNTESLIKGGSKALDAAASGADGVLGALDANDGKGSHILTGSDEKSAAKAGFSFPVFKNPSSLFNLLLGGDVDLVKYDSGPLSLAFDWRQQFGPVYAPPPVMITLHGSASVSMRVVAGFDTYGIRKSVEAVRDGTLTAATVGEAILQSLYFATVDEQGKPIPVVSFRGEIAAGAAVSAVILTVGIEGGVALTVSFLWNDPNHDGKFRISEFARVALNNPICLFTVSGRVSVFLKVYIQIGFGPFSVSFDFTLIDATLLDFSATPDCSPPPPKTAALGDGGQTLIVYAAALGHATQRGNANWDSDNTEKDTVKITSLHDYTDSANPAFTGVAVEMLGIRNEFLNANIKRVIVDGRGYDHPMNITFVGDGKEDTSKSTTKPPTMSFEKDAIVFGGNKNDQIKTGIGNSWIDGGPGDDTIVTGDRTVLLQDATSKDYSYANPTAKAWVAGGAGNDHISVGNGNDIVAGDGTLDNGRTRAVSGLKELKNSTKASENVESGDPTENPGWGTSINVPDWTQFPEPQAQVVGPQGDDVISAGLGAGRLYGNGGNDTLSIAPDNPLVAVAKASQRSLFVSAGATLVGGTGSDTIAGGSGNDTIITGPDAGGLDTNPDADGGADPGSVNVVDTGTGNDTVYGSTGADRITGRSLPTQHDDLRGGAGEDILLGGYGKDRIFGGPGNDYVIAEPSTVDLGTGAPANDGIFGPLYAVTHLPLPAGTVPSSKTLVGGTGDDHIFGGDGGAAIDGDGYHKTARCGPGVATPSDSIQESAVADDGNDKIIGGAGVENIRAGGGNDLVEARGNADLVCGEGGNDTLRGGDGADQIWGGSGSDAVFGDAGADALYGNDGDDAVYGGDGDDVIEGNDGVDFVSGGAGDDHIVGGTQLAGRPDAGDILNGDVGHDAIIGDNGTVVGGVWQPLDLDGTTPTAGGKDRIFGGDGDDVAYGGLDDDTMSGGNGNDHLEGNNGNDVIDGDAGEDELIGGGHFQVSSGVGYPDGSDTIHGGAGADVIAGDNATVSAVAAGTGTDTTLGREFTLGHTIALLDLGYTPTAGTSAGDRLFGDGGTDVIYGQGGDDAISGGSEDDYAEGGPGADTIHGDDGEDDLVGGSSTPFAEGVGQPDAGDVIHGDAGADVILGDNGAVLRAGAASPLTDRGGMLTQRRIVLLDLGASPHAASSGDDLVTGDDGSDVILGQGGNDRLKGNAEGDYVEGGPGSDWIEGGSGDDDLVGGSSTPQSGSGDATVGQPDSSDAVFGGPGDDAVVGDNALLLRVGDRSRTFERLSESGARIASRHLQLYDLGTNYLSTPAASLFGDDRISGGSGVDVIYGQDGDDQISGGPGADYLEGNGGRDVLRGDRRLDQPPAEPGAAATTPLTTGWPGSPAGFDELEGAGPDGQDDMIGGSSLPNFRDTGDNISGDGAGDFQLGDNGVLQRDIQGEGMNLAERVFTHRYPAGAVPADAVVVRVGAASVNPNGTTRFCTEAQATCEKPDASGDDVMLGGDGDDTMWGQDGDDIMRGGSGDDSMYGELGDDRMWGEDGNDAMLGDRGGVVDRYEDGSRAFSVDVNQVPKVHYDGFVAGTMTRQTDLQHDVNGDAFVASATAPKMPHPGDVEGGNDRMRGGNGTDAMHGGAGDDLINGDSGGDAVFGGDGADVLWGGKGCDQAVDTEAVSPDCYPNGTFDVNARGTNDRMVDHILGGKGATSGPSVDPVTGALGSDLLDWRPRGAYGAPGETTCTANPWPQTFGNGKNSVTVDPCAWFEMTDLDNATDADNQHHQGIDWQYGGWDRDVLQADVAQNGPNDGDRLLDWNGAFNLFTHCNSAYGGYNDVRQHSPAWQAFLQQWAYSLGAGQQASDVANGSRGVGTSAFVELALVYPGSDNEHGSGKAYPGTPGHFDDPNACAP